MDATLVIQSHYGKKVGTATVNEFDEASLEKVVRRAEELAKLAPENPEFMEPLPKQKYGESKTFADATARITPASILASSSRTSASLVGSGATVLVGDFMGFSFLLNPLEVGLACSSVAAVTIVASPGLRTGRLGVRVSIGLPYDSLCSGCVKGFVE